MKPTSKKTKKVSKINPETYSKISYQDLSKAVKTHLNQLFIGKSKDTLIKMLIDGGINPEQIKTTQPFQAKKTEIKLKEGKIVSKKVVADKLNTRAQSYKKIALKYGRNPKNKNKMEFMIVQINDRGDQFIFKTFGENKTEAQNAMLEMSAK